MSRALTAPAVLAGACLVLPSALLAQTAPPPRPPLPSPSPQSLEVNVTANRVPTAIQRTGSAITVITAEEIARTNPGTLNDLLRGVPGVDLSETGGPGATTTVRLRGANSGQTLVLLDGVRLNDASGPSGEFDASLIAPGLIERIEVLRGPQSALYGSDAIGGVINIITKKGQGAPRVSVGVEAGSYGTVSTVASAAGAIGPWSYAVGGLAQRSDGFSRYGYRIGRLDAQGPFTPDGYARIGGFGRIGYDPGNGFRFDVGVLSTYAETDYDAAFGAFPDTPSAARRSFTQVSAKAELDTFDGRLTHSLQLFANRTERRARDVSYFTVGGVRNESRSKSDFFSSRYGAEYQGLLRLEAFGSLIFGGRWERETVDLFSAFLPGPRDRTLAAEQDTASAFALWQLPIGERLSLSLGARYDKVSDSRSFPTWRATAAYLIPETGTKLRASAGTGAKAPTLYQRFSEYGTPNLRPERSTGYDAGIDQDLFDGRVTLSLTGFFNRFDNLIDFTGGPPCLATQPFGCYVNVQRAETSGLEASARITLIEGLLSVSGSYTHLRAKDLTTRRTLARRPGHAGRVAFQITPAPGWRIEPSVTFVSERFSGNNETQRLAPYARFDVAAEYSVNETWRVHARVENITDARYQEVYNYGTTGRAFYAGLTATW